MADLIRYVLTHLPTILFVVALAIPTLIRTSEPWAERYLSWLLLLAVGVECAWAGFFHVFFPQTAASFIGWQVSPFQFEIGVADLAIGITAIISFWRSLDFKAAVVCYISLFYAGVAVGHIHQAEAAANFSPGNFGFLLVMTLIKVVLLPALLWAAYRARAGQSRL